MEMERDKREENVQEAGLAERHGDTLHSEIDLADHHDATTDEVLEEEHIDYSHFSKHELANLVKDLAKEDNFKRVDSKAVV